MDGARQAPHLLRFPCPYPLKVMGNNTNEFVALVIAVIERHLAEGDKVTYRTRVSSGEKYMSVTATFEARSLEQLNAIYEELSRHQLVLMLL